MRCGVDSASVAPHVLHEMGLIFCIVHEYEPGHLPACCRRYSDERFLYQGARKQGDSMRHHQPSACCPFCYQYAARNKEFYRRTWQIPHISVACNSENQDVYVSADHGGVANTLDSPTITALCFLPWSPGTCLSLSPLLSSTSCSVWGIPQTKCGSRLLLFAHLS